MSKAGKAAEPSMEEILSSIRKIIAEEPVASTGPAPQKAAVDDVLEMADGAPRTEMGNMADVTKPAAQVPSWLFPTAHPEATVATAAIVKPEEPQPTAEAARDTPKPFFPAAGARPEAKVPAAAVPARVGTNGVHPRAPAEPKASEDLGAVVPRRNPEPAATPTVGVTERRTPQAGLPDWLSRAAGGGAKPVAAPQPISAPAEPTRIAAREPEAAAPALSELAKPLGATVAAEKAAAETGADAPTVPATASVAATLSTDDASVVAAAAPAEEAPTAIVEKSAGAVATVEAAAHSAVAKPTVVGERTRSPKSNGATEVVAAMAQPGAVRTLDDTIIDLLRPMIRQWLDDNMPRMVEKALRVELAASVKSKGDQSKH